MASNLFLVTKKNKYMGYDLVGLNPKAKAPKPTHPLELLPQGTSMTMAEVEATGYFEELEKWEEDAEGASFRASMGWWAPIRFLSYVANDEHKLGITNIDDWAYNDGATVEEQFCAPLADAIEKVIPEAIPFWDELEDNHTFYWCVGHWDEIKEDSKYVNGCDEETKSRLNDVHYMYQFIKEPAVIDGRKFAGSYFVQKGHIKEFINFLRNCGGFNIY